MTFQSLAAILTVSLLSAAPVMAQDTEEVVREIVDGFRYDRSAPDAYHADCHGRTLRISGAGGIVGTLTQIDPSMLRTSIKAIVVSRFPPDIDCNEDGLVVATKDEGDFVFYNAGADVQVLFGR